MSGEAVEIDELCVLATIGNLRGLHARAAAKLVKLAESFSSDVSVQKEDMRVSARSIMGLMMLAATKDTVIQLCAKGSDAVEALEAISQLVKRKFDEE